MQLDATADAFVFHTRLIRVTDAVKRPQFDAMRAMTRLWR